MHPGVTPEFQLRMALTPIFFFEQLGSIRYLVWTITGAVGLAVYLVMVGAVRWSGRRQADEARRNQVLYESNLRLLLKARDRATNLEILDKIAKAVNSTLEMEALFKIAVEQVRRLIPYHASSLYAIDEGRKVVTDYWLVGHDEDRMQWMERSRDFTGSQFDWILETRKPFYEPDTRDTAYSRLQPLAEKGLLSCACVPVLGGGECLGFLNVVAKEADAFSSEDIGLLCLVAEHLAVAMKNAELYQQARETGERLDNFVRSASDGIITVDLEGRVTSWNSGAEAIYGYSEEEMLGRDVLRIYADPNTIQERRAEILKQVSVGESAPPWETMGRRNDGTPVGTPVEVSITISPLRNSAGQLRGFGAIHRDIGVQKRSEEALRKSEEKYRSLFEEAGDAIEISDEEGRIIDCNQHACDLHGYTREELLGKRVQDIVQPELKEAATSRIARILREGGLSRFETANVRKDGSLIDLEVGATTIEIEGRKRIMYFLLDITERKQAQEMLMRSQKLASLGSLAAGMAHEILNPANIIGVRAQILSQEANNPEMVKRYSESINMNVRRIAKICDSLRKFSREGDSSLTRFDFGELIEETVSMVDYQSRVEDISFSLELPDGPLSLEADRDQMAQILLNLIGNASDAMPGGGVITVSLESFEKEGARWVRISVQDEGEGIPEDQIPHIFDPFFTTKDEDKGTGLGLSIIHGVVEGHGGGIDVESQVGKGTTFRIELPCRSSGLVSAESERHTPKAAEPG